MSEQDHLTGNMHGGFEEHQRSLVDYWNVMAQHKWVIVGFVILAVIASIIYEAKFSPPIPYPYVSVIEIGGLDGGLIESASVVEQKINTVYAPQVLREIAQQKNMQDDAPYGVSVEAGSSTVMIKSFGLEASEKDISAMEKRIGDLVINDHQNKLVAIRRGFEREKFRAQLVLDSLQDQEKQIPLKYRRIEEARQVLRKSISDTKMTLEDLDRTRSTVIASSRDSNSSASIATMILLLDNDIQKYRSRLFDMESQSSLKLRQEYDDLDKEVLDLKRSQKEQQKIIEDIEYKNENIAVTRELVPPTRDFRNVHKKGVQVVTLAGVSACLFGIFLAFFIEFIKKARKQALLSH